MVLLRVAQCISAGSPDHSKGEDSEGASESAEVRGQVSGLRRETHWSVVSGGNGTMDVRRTRPKHMEGLGSGEP